RVRAADADIHVSRHDDRGDGKVARHYQRLSLAEVDDVTVGRDPELLRCCWPRCQEGACQGQKCRQSELAHRAPYAPVLHESLLELSRYQSTLCTKRPARRPASFRYLLSVSLTRASPGGKR